MPEKVCATIVTYNRLELLKNTIAALQAQTFALSQIFVVNNGSTDGTVAWLNDQPAITVIHQENSGGAGGFFTGVKAALGFEYEWVWLMDDDVAPDATCLETLLNYKTYSKCLHPLRVYNDGSIADEERIFDITDCSLKNLYNQSYKNGKKIWYRNIGCFEGMLISTNIVEKIGLPDVRFFIAHDDLIYGYLANKYTNVAVVKEAVMRRQPVTRSEAASLTSEYYYMNRNLWLLEEYAERELQNFTSYRKRRIKLHFLYTIYKILFVDKPKQKFKALQTLAVAYKHYKQKKAGHL